MTDATTAIGPFDDVAEGVAEDDGRGTELHPTSERNNVTAASAANHVVNRLPSPRVLMLPPFLCLHALFAELSVC